MLKMGLCVSDMNHLENWLLVCY